MIELTDHGAVRELRLARPPANAFNPDLTRELTEQIIVAPTDGAQAIVISGAPGMFTAGLDVPELLTLDRDEMLAFWQSFHEMLRVVASSEVPVVAAITGHSPAAGAVLVAFCDHRVMAEGRFKIGMNEVQVGLSVPPFIQYAMKRLTGARVGDALLIAGALIAPAEALRVGLVDEVVPEDEVVPTAISWAERTVALPRAAMLETRRIGRADLVAQFANITEADHEKSTERWFGEETQTAMRTMVERLAAR